ncbi:MAG: CHAD domain-containing protein, partial [Chrysiogenetes bacterium]|nr:CHAD domain-containing protein [Chrysiogenetes bacterium]
MTEISSIVVEEIPVAKRKKSGLRHWMQEASRLRAAALEDLDEATVHDLRVALRRCRAMVQTIREIDDDPGWQKLNRAAREIFQALGELRDTQVQLLWLQHLSTGEDILATRLQGHLQKRERELRALARQVIEVFDEKRWEKWTEKFPQRLTKLAGNVLAFEELAQRRLEEIESLDTKAAFERDEERYH